MLPRHITSCCYRSLRLLGQPKACFALAAPKQGVKSMKTFIITLLLLSSFAFACDEQSKSAKESPIDCTTNMRDYAEVVESYSTAIDSINLQELASFRDWLNGNTDTHITCGEWNRSDALSEVYKAIFISHYQLIGDIEGLIKSNDILGKPDDFIVRHMEQSYSTMREAVKRFNK